MFGRAYWIFTSFGSFLKPFLIQYFVSTIFSFLLSINFAHLYCIFLNEIINCFLPLVFFPFLSSEPSYQDKRLCDLRVINAILFCVLIESLFEFIVFIIHLPLLIHRLHLFSPFLNWFLIVLGEGLIGDNFCVFFVHMYEPVSHSFSQIQIIFVFSSNSFFFLASSFDLKSCLFGVHTWEQ